MQMKSRGVRLGVRGSGGGSGQGGLRSGDTGACVRRIGVTVKMQNKVGGSGRGDWLVARLGVVGDVQYWGCKPRIEGIVKCS